MSSKSEILRNFSVKINNYKCVSKEEQGFDKILPINLIIGRNNSGKSTLLEIVEYSTSGEFNIPESLWRNDKEPEFIFESPLTESEIRKVFNERTRAGGIPGSNHWEYGKEYCGVKLKWRNRGSQGKAAEFMEFGDCSHIKFPLEEIREGDSYISGLAKAKVNYLFNRIFKRISAEREIISEEDNNNIQVSSNGGGITNIIQNFINKANLPSDLVEKTLLSELNEIFQPDSFFSDIVCQQIEGGKWEIYLEEEQKGRVPLSHTGSGLKTILMVLVHIHLIPRVEEKSLDRYVFAFEELENNLHPALFRNLLNYINEVTKRSNCLFFLTTHSNVAIDLYNKNPDVQIIHVTHDGEKSRVKEVMTYIENKGILDDLDIRASDLLQSNGIIWVEGPSDRIYLNRWISLWSNGEILEGVHYQCVFYGGRLLSHLRGNDPNDDHSGISILRVNSNAVMLIDSDKKSKYGRINETKKRIQSEVINIGGVAWITKGKEIENYIPSEAVCKFLGEERVSQVEPFENFFDYIDKIKSGSQKYSTQKTLLAEELIPYFSKNNLKSVLDLSDRLTEICTIIRKWNSL